MCVAFFFFFFAFMDTIHLSWAEDLDVFAPECKDVWLKAHLALIAAIMQLGSPHGVGSTQEPVPQKAADT